MKKWMDLPFKGQPLFKTFIKLEFQLKNELVKFSILLTLYLLNAYYELKAD